MVSSALFILLGLTQGVGLVMIIPFLHTLGLPGDGGKSSGFTAIVSRIFSAMGLPFTIYSILGAYIVIVSIFAVLKHYRTVLDTEIQQGFIRHLRNRLYRALTYTDWLFIARERSSDITHSLTSDIQRIGSGTLIFLQFSSSVVLILFHIVVAGLLSLPLTGLTVVFGLVMFFSLRPFNREALSSGFSFRRSRQALYEAVMEHLAGMKTAKSFGVESHHIERLESINEEIEAQTIRFTRARARTRMYYEITAVIFLSIFFTVAVKVFHVPTARLLLLVFIFTRLLPQFSALQQQYQNIKNMLPAFDGAGELYRRARDSEEFKRDPAAETFTKNSSKRSHSMMSLNRGISFRNVLFRYSADRESYALYDASFDIPALKVTAVSGASGAGKSTLADLLLGLLKPGSGKIAADDTAITGDRLYGWRYSTGYVPQETFLFHDTIRANLLWACPSATEEDLWEALEMAAAVDFIERLPEGLDTLLGDRGITLSGGERQRVALARALLRKPRLLLLDEATSALDNANEERIYEAIESLKGRLTIVIIAHRLSTLKRADHVILLEKGRVTETGSWDSLSDSSVTRGQKCE
ncbi:MAG: ABC transporter ATP-binding protein [bacterium]|nr:ABC transporter ATP-binding protein [bacterium]